VARGPRPGLRSLRSPSPSFAPWWPHRPPLGSSDTQLIVRRQQTPHDPPRPLHRDRRGVRVAGPLAIDTALKAPSGPRLEECVARARMAGNPPRVAAAPTQSDVPLTDFNKCFGTITSVDPCSACKGGTESLVAKAGEMIGPGFSVYGGVDVVEPYSKHSSVSSSAQ
jgi:hypothetical protein